MKIAIIGSGISGLVSAHHLSSKAEVHVFEANSYVGGHTNTVEVSTPSGNLPVDTGFIVFNDRTYPRFIRLMNRLQVPSQKSSMSFSVKVEKNRLEYNGTNLNTLFAQRTNFLRPSFYRMIRDILRFNKEAPSVLAGDSTDRQLSLRQYLAQHAYSSEFMNHYIIPMGAAIWSSGVKQMGEFPIEYFVRFFKNHGMLSVNDRPQWRVIKNGSRSYLPAITHPFKDQIYRDSPVKKIRREEDHVILSVERNGVLEEARFDHVVLASHADESLALLSDATSAERDILSAFSYQENITLLHTDISVLPTNRLAWASWNYWVPAEERNTVAVTYDMNILQSLPGETTYLVSLNMEDKISTDKVLKKIVYHHPVYSQRAVEAQKKWNLISGVGRTHFAGAYWGFGFHEDGVASGERVCEHFGMTL